MVKESKETITTNITVKRPISSKEKNELLAQIVESDKIITDLTMELKEYTADKKDSIEQERLNISRCCQLARDGFENVMHECTVKYEDGMTQFISVVSGEVVEEHKTTEEEQLRFSSNWKDAEEIIREDTREND